MNDVYDLVRSLRAAAWPRNRHFEAHATQAGAAARRLHRFLRGVERDLLAAAHVAVRRHDTGLVVELTFPTVRLSRVVSLTHQEHELLAENADIAARLRPTG